VFKIIPLCVPLALTRALQSVWLLRINNALIHYFWAGETSTCFGKKNHEKSRR